MDHNTAAVMATKLMQQHLPNKGWVGRWDESLTRAGACSFANQTIYLSAPWVKNATEEEVEQTILHEIAHALAGARANHGPVWKATARSIGYTGKRTVKQNVSLSLFPIIGTCDKCGTQVGRQKMMATMRDRRLSHRVCNGVFDWKRVR